MSDTTDRIKECAQAVQVILPPHTGFVILAFDFDTKDPLVESVSNATPEIMRLLTYYLKAMSARAPKPSTPSTSVRSSPPRENL